MNLKGKLALITGASRGIGKAILTALAEEEMVVIGTATTQDGADKISQYLQEKGFSGQGVVLSVNDDNAVNETIRKITQTFSIVSVLVNNAGITEDNLLMRMKNQQWEQVIDTNLSGVFRLSKAVLRDMMKAREGRIINIASVVGIMGNPGQTNYAAAKAGIIGFSKSLAREVGSRGITVNTVAPGFIATDMTDKIPEEQRKILAERIPMEKLGQVEDVAQAVTFLAKADYITGETLNVNGGMYMI